MNDAEIIKALECCSMPHTEVKCFCCKSTNVDICSKLNPTIILDLINRQKAEIEKLESKNNTLTIDNAILKSIIGSLKDDIQTAKSEAIREFAEKLKEKSCNHLVEYDEGGWSERVSAVKVENIDSLVEEMTSDEDTVK